MKNWLKPNRFEWITFLVIMPFLCLLLNNLLFGMNGFRDYKVWLLSFPTIYMLGLVSWYLHIVTMHWLRMQFPHIRQTSRRLILLFVTHITLMFLTCIVLFYSYDASHFLGYHLNTRNLQFALYWSIGVTMISTTMWEAEYTFKQWKATVAEKEKLEQLTIQQEFDTLKSQVNPHFLFNCFNTLSSLISEDRKAAEQFLNELSKVYRYLLRNNEDGLSTLQTEIRFIESYYQLLKTRHGDALHMQIEIDKKYEHYMLPSLSLQLLVENAVKHNMLSRNKPLAIDIFTTSGNRLVVTNNLQLRTVKSQSNKIGLENIKSKYELLNHYGFQVLDDNKNFSVVLPLIWNRVVNNRPVTIA